MISMLENVEDSFERKGYEAFMELWIVYGVSPSAHICPARRIPDGSLRSAFIRG